MTCKASSGETRSSPVTSSRGGGRSCEGGGTGSSLAPRASEHVEDLQRVEGGHLFVQIHVQSVPRIAHGCRSKSTTAIRAVARLDDSPSLSRT